MSGEGAPAQAGRLLAAAGVLAAAFLLAHAVRGNWASDFWEHASVIRELAARPASPGHPQLDAAAPSAYFSPYHLLGGLLSRVTGLSPSAVLALFGAANLALLGWALFVFAGRFATSVRPQWTAAVHAAFLLLLWGQDPWSWSAFLHLRVVGRTLPYPSTFCIALSLVGAAELSRFLEAPAPRRLLLPTLAWTAVLLCHPPTALFYAALAAAVVAAAAPKTPRHALAGAAAAGTTGLLLALLWPLYPFPRLLDGSQAGLWDAGSGFLYESVFSRCWPAFLLGTWGFWRRRRHGSLDPLAGAAAVLASLYAYAALRHGGWGRVIAYLMLVLQFAAADAVVGAVRPDAGRAWGLAALAGAAMGLLNLAPSAVGGVLKDDLRTLDRGFWRALPGLVGPRDVVLAERPLEETLPAFAGRVVAYRQSNYFVRDFPARRADSAAFFAPRAPCESQRRTVARWGVRFLAWDRTSIPETMAARFKTWGPTAYSGPRLILVGPLKNPACPETRTKSGLKG